MNKPSFPAPPRICVPCRLAAIGAVALSLAGGFAYVAGWLTPARLTSQRIINAFEANSGPEPGFRRNHAKGVCFVGRFDSNGNAATLSSAGVFAPGSTPVIGRFAIPGGNPSAADTSVPIRSMALLFTQRDGQQWRTAMNSTPVFAVRTPTQFFQQLIAARPDPATGKPDPVRLKAFYAAHPETRPFLTWVAAHPPSSSLVNASYYSIDAFRFVDAQGHRQAVRWAFIPETPYAPITAEEKTGKNFLQADLAQRLAAGHLRWHLIVTVAAPTDKTDDATLQWPADRRQIDAGTLVLETSAPQDEGPCRDVNFDPTILPAGIQISDDPLLAARSSAYSVSFNRRTREEVGKADKQQLMSNPESNGGQS